MRILLLSTLTVLALSCGDKGAVKDQAPPTRQEAETPQASAAEPAAPPLASGRTGADLPPGHPPIGGAGTSNVAIPPPPAGSGTGATGLAWATPAGWVEEQPDSQMRRAQYKVPGAGGDAECAVFYFGPGQGGEPMANAQRWAGQFKNADGSSAESSMTTSNGKIGDLSVLRVEVHGTYNGGMTMTAEPATPKPGYMLLGAIAEGPDANWFFKLTGPESTVKAQKAAFDSMIDSLRRGK